MSAGIRMRKCDLNESIRLSNKLTEKISDDGFKPDRILGIARGGLLPAYEISQGIGTPMEIVHVARPFTRLKNSLRLNLLPPIVARLLRQAEMKLQIYKRLPYRNASVISSATDVRSYLIVDDSLDTGRTVGTVIKNLLDNGVERNQIRIAVITQIFEDAEPSADWCAIQNTNVTFPWSADSIHHEEFKLYCRDRRIVTDTKPGIAKESDEWSQS